MTERFVEGYRIVVERDGENFVVTVPDLPGCVVQVSSETQIAREIKKAIGAYLLDLVGRMPGEPRKTDPPPSPIRPARGNLKR